ARGGDRAEELQPGPGGGPQRRGRADGDAERDTTDQRDRVPGQQAQHRRYDVDGEPALRERRREPRLARRADDLGQRRAVERGAPGARDPPHGEDHHGQAEGQQHRPGDPAQRAHAATSPRTDGCQNSTRCSRARASTLTTTPSSPATTTYAYIESTAPDDCAMPSAVPMPGVPTRSSPVTVRMSATLAASRRPVIAYGRVVGHTTVRIRVSAEKR